MLIFLLALLGIVLLVSFRQGDFLFYKPTPPEKGASSHHKGDKTVLFGKRKKYYALLLFPKNKGEHKGTVLHFHGNSLCAERHIGYVRWLTRHGYTVAMLEYPGYGAAPGRPSRESLHKAGGAFLEWAVQSATPPFFIIGQSLGGVVALDALGDVDIPEVCAIVVEGAFANYRGVGAAHVEKTFGRFFSKVLAWWLLSNKHNAGPAAQKLKNDVAFLSFHARGDPIVPWEEGVKLFLSVKNPEKIMVPLAGDRHLGCMSTVENRHLILALLEEAARDRGF
ncbi:MAG: alpha/beta hydrolase [Gammaproteobacteria bacterium]|nr:alpha/beta hydrolase [Gammaproteobacteria bacterium]